MPRYSSELKETIIKQMLPVMKWPLSSVSTNAPHFTFLKLCAQVQRQSLRFNSSRHWPLCYTWIRFLCQQTNGSPQTL